jgi:two-component system, cell cycle sensor histidine kinase and response regulator CckA
MTLRTRPRSVVLVTPDPNDQALVAALLAQAGAGFTSVIPGPPEIGPLLARLRLEPDAVCLIDESLCCPADLMPRLVAEQCPVIVLSDVDDLARGEAWLEAGAWDCLARTTLTPSALAKSVSRAVEHARHLQTATGAQAALAASEARFRSLVRNAVHGILHTLPDGTIAEANPALAHMLGFESETDLLNRCVLDFYHDALDRALVLESLQQPGRVAPVEVQWTRRDGSLFWVRLSGRSLAADDGSVAGYEVLAEDVTEHRTLEVQFRQAQKMEALGRLAGGVAHDFNNLLTALFGYAEILRDQIDPGDPRRTQVEEISKAAERGSTLTRQLLTFSRKQAGAPQSVDLNVLVRGFERMLRRLIGEDIDLVTTLPADLGRVRAHPGQIEQVLMNLAINGRDAMAVGGRLTIETANVELDPGYTRTHASLEPGPYVMLAVSDTGCGMTAEVKTHLFEPFFTTKESGKGSGLGLATVYGIVQQSGGHIFVYSEPRKGSTFKIYLPRIAQSEAEGAAPAPAPVAPKGTETILLVEDEPSVRTLARELLQSQGYTVLLANHGREGLGVANAYPDTIDVVITDVVMPEMGGPEMVRHLWWTRPKLRVLYMSGYTDQTAAQMGLQEPWTTFLQKPFTPDALALAVRRALDGEDDRRG